MNAKIRSLDTAINSPALGTAALRITLGVVLLAHSVYLKGVIFTLPGTAQYFASIGLPAFSAYLVFTVEVIAGISILLGYQSRLFAAAVIPILIGATWAHSGNGWLFSNANGGWEYPLVLVGMAIAQVGLGDGKFALVNLRLFKKTNYQSSVA